MSVTINITLDTRRLKVKNNNYPVKLLVIFDREIKRYQTIFDLSEQEFNNLSSSRISDKLQKVREKLKLIGREAETIANDILPFTFEQFEKDYILNNPLFKQRKNIIKTIVEKTVPVEFDYTDYIKQFPLIEKDFKIGTIGYTYKEYIKMLIRLERIGTADCYHTSYRAIIKFAGNITFAQIDKEFLMRFELWMSNKGNSKGTTGIYLRGLRTMYNDAVENKIIKKDDHYPFGRKKYVIPSKKKTKKALGINHVEQIYNYIPNCEEERKARDFWLFLYFGNGMNADDMIHLKWKDKEKDFIIFDRAKTELTNRVNSEPIKVCVTPEIEAIIDRWSSKDKTPDNYIFPVLRAGLNPLEEHDLKKLFIHYINDWMEKIRTKLGIEKKSTTVVARHTFATVMRREGVPTEFVKDALGHASAKTTDNYYDSFEDDVKKQFAAKLASFKKTFTSEEKIAEGLL